MIIYKQLKPIKAITFDLDDTLYDNYAIIRNAEASLKSLLQQQYPRVAQLTTEQWSSIRASILDETPMMYHDVSLMRLTTLTRAFSVVGYNKEDGKRSAQHCYDTFYNARSDFSVASSTVECLQALAKRVPIAAITNGNVDCQQIGLGKVFSYVLRPSLKHASKPHSDLFDHMAQLLDLPSQSILHVGDNLINDVLGALSAHYQAAWLAVDRPMNLDNEPVTLLPHIQLTSLEDLFKLLP